MWLNLYGHQTVQCKLKKGLKHTHTQKNAFLASFRVYIGQPDDHIGLSHINALHINLSY